MKKIMSIVLTALLLSVSLTAMAGGEPATALDAFATITGEELALGAVQLTSDEYLDKVMAGGYSPAPADMEAGEKMAPELAGLSSVTTKDIAVYATARNLEAAQVRNAYFKALANVLRAEIMVNPASEENYKNVQTILTLFLNQDNDALVKTSKDAVRSTITKAQTQLIAEQYSIPSSFVEFVVMDDNWEDESWQNDNAWREDTGLTAWNTDDRYDSLDDYRDTDGIDNTPDYNTPDYNTPDKNTPDKNTPDNTPDYDTPAARNTSTKPASTKAATTTKYNTPDNTPDYNTPDKNTPDKNTPDNTPDRNTPDNTPD